MMKLKENPIEGTTIQMDGFEIIVPALNFRQIKALAPDIKKMDQATDDMKRIDAQLKVVLQAIKRNYPDATISDLEEGLDMNNLTAVIMASMGQKVDPLAKGKPEPAGL
jgi:hypothetical protein